MKTIFTLFLFVSIPIVTHAQISDAFKNQMQFTFRYVDRNKVTTGLLYDYGLMLTNVEKFNGVRSDSNHIDYAAWQLRNTTVCFFRFNGNAVCRESVRSSFG